MSPRNGVTIPMDSQPRQWHAMKLQRNLSTQTSAAHCLAAPGPVPEAGEDPHGSRRQWVPTMAVRNQGRSTASTPMATLTSITMKPLRTSMTRPRAIPLRHPRIKRPTSTDNPAQKRTRSPTPIRLGQLGGVGDGHNVVEQDAWKSSDSMITDPGGLTSPRPKNHRQVATPTIMMVDRPAQMKATTAQTTIRRPMATLVQHRTMKTHSCNTRTVNPALVAVGKP